MMAVSWVFLNTICRYRHPCKNTLMDYGIWCQPKTLATRLRALCVRRSSFGFRLPGPSKTV